MQETTKPLAGFSYSRAFFEDLVDTALAHAKKLGATDAGAEASEGSGLSVSVRKGDLETVERNRDKSLGVTVYLGQRGIDQVFEERAGIRKARQGLGGFLHVGILGLPPEALTRLPPSLFALRASGGGGQREWPPQVRPPRWLAWPAPRPLDRNIY